MQRDPASGRRYVSCFASGGQLYARRASRNVRTVDEEWHVCVQVNVTLIVLFNYYYTFLQLDPKDMADQLKRAGGAIPAVRPGRATADYITKTLNRMSILGSAFLGALAAAPPLVEAVTGLQVRLPAIFSVQCRLQDADAICQVGLT